MLALYDGAIGGGRIAVVLDMVDASALLWRLHLRGDRRRRPLAGLAETLGAGIADGQLRLQRRARHDGVPRRRPHR